MIRKTFLRVKIIVGKIYFHVRPGGFVHVGTRSVSRYNLIVCSNLKKREFLPFPAGFSAILAEVELRPGGVCEGNIPPANSWVRRFQSSRQAMELILQTSAPTCLNPSCLSCDLERSWLPWRSEGSLGSVFSVQQEHQRK